MFFFVQVVTSISFLKVTLDELLDTSNQASKKLMLLLETCPNSKIDEHLSPVPQRLSDLSKSCKEDAAFIQARNNLRVSSPHSGVCM